MIKSLKRSLKLSNIENHSIFLWGPRQVGKSTFLKENYPHSVRYNLLNPKIFEQFQKNPSTLLENLKAVRPQGPVIIDEVQKIPALLDTIQLLIDDEKIPFILSGSSSRKLKRGGGNLLGGRALHYEMFPFVFSEIPNFDLLRALNHGLLPPHYLSENPREPLHAYVGDYLKEEIVAEAATRNIQAFTKFLEMSAFSNGEMVNYAKIASECGVRAGTVKDYFQILEDTLIGCFVESFRLKPKRRVIEAPKFYFFDVGVINFLLKRGKIETGSELFGKAFEHFIFMELRAYSHYSRKLFPVSYWRTASDYEVDFILGDAEAAVEVKASDSVVSHHTRGLSAFSEEYQTGKKIIVSLDSLPRVVGNIQILPWKIFLEKLWAGEII